MRNYNGDLGKLIAYNVGAACRSGVNYYKLLNITKMNKRFTKINRKIK